MSTADGYERFLFALTLWREARGESTEAKRAVAHVILNRVLHPAYPDSISGVILQKYQFSSFNANDPNATKFPLPNDPTWLDCCAVADAPGMDNTNGAVLYHSPMAFPPKWANAEKLTAKVGPFCLYKT